MRPCTVTRRTPAASARRASSGEVREKSSQPSRIFNVTGTRTACTTASIKVSAWGRSRISAEPDWPPVTCFAVAHVDVRAGILRDARTLGHPPRLADGELDDVQPRAVILDAAARHAALGGAPTAGKSRARCHFRNDQPGAERHREPTKRCVGDA